MADLVQIAHQPIDTGQGLFLSKLLGKRVISQNGSIIGKVRDLFMKDYTVTGIIVKGAYRSDHYIERRFFDSFTKNAVVLNIDPFTRIIGLRVLDKNGRYLGKVSDIEREDTLNDISRFYVKKSFIRRAKEFYGGDIESVSQHVILNNAVDDS